MTTGGPGGPRGRKKHAEFWGEGGKRPRPLWAYRGGGTRGIKLNPKKKGSGGGGWSAGGGEQTLKVKRTQKNQTAINITTSELRGGSGGDLNCPRTGGARWLGTCGHKKEEKQRKQKTDDGPKGNVYR